MLVVLTPGPVNSSACVSKLASMDWIDSILVSYLKEGSSFKLFLRSTRFSTVEIIDLSFSSMPKVLSMVTRFNIWGVSIRSSLLIVLTDSLTMVISLELPLTYPLIWSPLNFEEYFLLRGTIEA